MRRAIKPVRKETAGDTKSRDRSRCGNTPMAVVGASVDASAATVLVVSAEIEFDAQTRLPTECWYG